MRRILPLLLCLACISCRESSQNTLYLFTWAEFFNPDLIAKFEEACQCRVVVDSYDSNESLYAKLKLGASGYDVILPSGYYLEILKKQGMIQPIDQELIPNLARLDPRYYQPSSSLWGVPFAVSYSAIAYRKDRLGEIEPTWGVFGNEQYSGRMTMLNDNREAIGAALKYLGYSINSTNPDELRQAGDLLLEWRSNLAKFETEQYKSGIATAEFLVVQGYSSDIIQVILEEEGVEYLFPKEGAILSIDYMAIPTEARNVQLACQFINFFLDPKNAAENMLHSPARIPVEGAYQHLDPRLQNSPILFPSEEHLDNMEKIQDVQEKIELYYQTWERVKSG